MDEWKRDRIGSILSGKNPTLIEKMKSGFAVMGDPQFLPGYCILIAYPQVRSLNDLDIRGRKDFLLDMSLLGDAINATCNPLKINYDILGNTDAFLHAHVFPRYEWEEEDKRKRPVWLYPKEYWNIEEYQFCENKHNEMKMQLMIKLKELMEGNYK